MNARKLVLGSGLVVALLGALPAAATVMVTDLVGKAKSGEATLALLANLEEGRELDLAEGSRLTAIDLGNGREYSLRGPGRYKVESGGLRVLKGPPVEVATVPGAQLPSAKATTQRLAQASFVMRDVRQATGAESPARHLIAVLPATLRWESVPGANVYHVAINDEQGLKLFAAHSANPELALPPGLVQPDRRYRWRVEARAGERLLADIGQMFTLADAATIERLASARAAAGSDFARRVLYALQLREVGADSDARAEWQLLASERPDDPRLRELAKGQETP